MLTENEIKSTLRCYVVLTLMLSDVKDVQFWSVRE